MTRDIQANMEPLPGYRLIERIGAGGYGEVWRAEAPGGLTKAIKFVFGQQHEKRAANELRALEHIRCVRHPFLLSLERIEIVDGRLLVVTELADRCVKDRFDQCRAENLRGIPREELLSYLRDAADALDFMSATYALQHLDIKPENLLVLAGHVKVADFGLVKDVRQSQVSLIGGMTPLYAAPEVFRGLPSHQSDQYSLAIVYQEMLTGTLPFIGNSTAELTLNHLNDEPDLSALAAVDRYVVARALAKDPQFRYATCREFVDALVSSADRSSDAPPGPEVTAAPPLETSPHSKTATARESCPTDFFDDDPPVGWQTGSAHQLLEMPPADCQLFDLPPLELSAVDSRLTPTLVLGVGGTAGHVLSHLRRKLNEHWNKCANVPAVQFLLLDTDTKSLTETARDDTNDFSADELLSLPLRRPQHYRDNSQQLLHWLSRRWLYNIPRSLRTEGLRPLGRLALADQARQVGQRVRRAMVQALDPGALAKSSATAGSVFRNDALRVFVVASISGGTGSGMSLDIGYAVRAILEKLNLPLGQIIGLMLHSTGRDARQSELARVNAFSWLTEFNHFHQADNAYPGDVSCGLPGHAPGVPAFDHTYVVQLGSNLDSTEYDLATQTVADYIRFNILPPASPFFDACREESAAARDGHHSAAATIRSFGMFRPTSASGENDDELGGLVVERVLALWRGSVEPRATHDDELYNQQFIHRLKVDAGGVAADSRLLIEHALGASVDSFVDTWLRERAGRADLSSSTLVVAIEDFFGRPDAAGQQSATLLGRTPAEIVAPLAEKLRNEFRQFASRRIDTPGDRLGGARRSVDSLQTHFENIKAELRRLRSATVDRLIELRGSATATPGERSSATGADHQSFARELFHTGLDHVTILAAEHVVGVLIAECKNLSEEITTVGREIDQIALAVGRMVTMRSASPTSPDASGNTSMSVLAAQRMTAEVGGIALQVDTQLQAECIELHGGFVKTVMQGGRPRAQLTSKLCDVAWRSVRGMLAGAHRHGIDEQSGADRDELRGAIALATPALLEFGGRRRVLAIVPQESADVQNASVLTQRLGKEVTSVAAVDGELVVCVEADKLALQPVALEIVERRRDRVEFAGRVHCRTDIDWSPLVRTEAPSTSIEWGSEVEQRPASQQALCQTMVM